MQTSQPIKRLLRYVPLFIVLVVAIGTFLAGDLYQNSLDLKAHEEGRNLKFMIVPDAESQCFSQQIYTSMPPKCKKLDGTFTKLGGSSSNSVIPSGK